MRNLSHLKNVFVINKIDDSIAEKVSDQNLLEFGLVYGDIIVYRQFFCVEQNSKLPTYRARVEELKGKLNKKHSG